MIGKWKNLALNTLAICCIICGVLLLYLWKESSDTWRNLGYCSVDNVRGRVHFYMLQSAEHFVILSDVTEQYPTPRTSADARSGIRYGAAQGRERFWHFALPTITQIGQHGHRFAGIILARQDGIDCSGYTEDVTHVALPHWLAAALTVPIPIWRSILLFRRRRRRLKNACPTCSYDLRAHTPGQNCPECGTPIAQTKH